MKTLGSVSVIFSALLVSFGRKKKHVEPSNSSSFYAGTYTDGKRLGSYKYILIVGGTNQTSNIDSLKRGKDTGQLKFTHQIYAPTPVCLLF